MRVKTIDPWLVAVVVLAFFFIGTVVGEIYSTFNRYNPDSRFCEFQIYKRPSGYYEVWGIGYAKYPIKVDLNYEQAKACQRERCETLKSMRHQKPDGERVK